MILGIITFLVAFAFLMMLILVARTMQMEHDPRQAIFSEGKVSNLSPEGFYQGSTGNQDTSWLGKKFDSANSKGINVFKSKDGTSIEKFPFKTFESNGLRDKKLRVLAIDYNIPENPLWLRFVLDEIVEIGPREYLGKLQVHLIPGMPTTLGYFELKKN